MTTKRTITHKRKKSTEIFRSNFCECIACHTLKTVIVRKITERVELKEHLAVTVEYRFVKLRETRLRKVHTEYVHD